MESLTRDELMQIRGRLFPDRTVTPEEAGADYSIDQFAATLLNLRGEMRTALDSLPASAFDATSSVEESGEESWNAGQIVMHIANSQGSMTGAVSQLLDQPSPADVEHADVDAAGAKSRADVIPMLESATERARQFFSSIPANPDFSRTMQHERLGTLGIKGWLTIMLVHELSHLVQLEALTA